MEEKEREEKIGRTVAGFARFLFVVKFLVVVTVVIALPVMYFLGKPLWMAPVFAVVLYVIYRLVWRLVFKIIEWAGRQ